MKGGSYIYLTRRRRVMTTVTVAQSSRIDVERYRTAAGVHIFDRTYKARIRPGLNKNKKKTINKSVCCASVYCGVIIRRMKVNSSVAVWVPSYSLPIIDGELCLSGKRVSTISGFYT
jgi:hypothetical protein